MNGMFDLSNPGYFSFIFHKTDSFVIVFIMDSITDLALDTFH